MKLCFAEERVLAVVAHPDDAELLCAGTLARAKSEGAAIGIAVLFQGDKGQSVPPIKYLSEVRIEEMRQAAEILGATVYWGGFPDGTLVDSIESRNIVTRIVRKFRPTLLLAHSAQDYHPDHRAASALTEAASWFCASVGQLPDVEPLAQPPELWWMDTVNMSEFQPHFFVDISGFLEIKRKMLHCHASQLARGQDEAFAPLEELMVRQATTRGESAGVAAAEAYRVHHVWKRVRAW